MVKDEEKMDLDIEHIAQHRDMNHNFCIHFPLRKARPDPRAVHEKLPSNFSESESKLATP